MQGVLIKRYATSILALGMLAIIGGIDHFDRTTEVYGASQHVADHRWNASFTSEQDLAFALAKSPTEPEGHLRRQVIGELHLSTALPRCLGTTHLNTGRFRLARRIAVRPTKYCRSLVEQTSNDSSTTLLVYSTRPALSDPRRRGERGQ